MLSKAPNNLQLHKLIILMAEIHNKLLKQQWNTKEFLTEENEIYSLNSKVMKMT